jgi:hypothetical protein
METPSPFPGLCPPPGEGSRYTDMQVPQQPAHSTTINGIPTPSLLGYSTYLFSVYGLQRDYGHGSRYDV